ncbi:MAG: MlaD family protein [Candidatus Solibacter sp.]
MPTPQQVTWAKFRSAAVILAALLILGTIVYLLTGGTLMEAKSKVYLYLPDATGIAEGVPVRVDGIGVGKVVLVELSGSSEPERVVRIVMDVDRDRLRSITSDSTAEPTSDTLIGDKFIDVTSGTSASQLAAGGEIKFKGSQDMMQRLDLAQFQQRLHLMELLLDDIEQGKGPVGELIQGETLYNEMRDRVAELQRGLHTAADTTSSLGQALYSDEMYRKLTEPLRQLDQSLARLEAGQGSLGALLREPNQYQQAMTQAGDLRRTIEALHQGEWMTSGAAYTAWSRLIEDMMRKVAEFDASPGMATPAVYDNLAGMAKELESTTKEFRANPQKYLRVKVF